MNVCPRGGKRSYPSRAQAKAAMRHAGGRVRVYLCPECRCWHVTKQARPHEHRQTPRRTTPTHQED